MNLFNAYNNLLSHPPDHFQVRGCRTLHTPIHKGSNLGAAQRKLAGSSVIT